MKMGWGPVNAERTRSPGLQQSSRCVHLKEKAPNVNMMYLWNVEIWVTFSIYLHYLVFYELTKLSGNQPFFLKLLFCSFSNLLGF